jgi:hypothetical protein
MNDQPRPLVNASPAGLLSYVIKQTLANPNENHSAASPAAASPATPPPAKPLPAIAEAIRSLSAEAPSDPKTDMSVPLGLFPHRGFNAPGHLTMGGLRWPGS